jgi:hypothetical protein
VDRSILARAVTPTGGVVEITEEVWAHVMAEHEELAAYLDEVVATLEYPDYYESDVRPGRERYFRRGVGPGSWLRVVIEFGRESDRLVTAFAQQQDPRSRR